MEYILIIGGIVLAYFVTYYFWKKLPKDTVASVEPVAPYKVEPPVEIVVVPVVEPIVEEVKSVVPELKVVIGSGSKTKRTKTPVKSTTKTPVKSTKTSVKPTATKTPAKPRTKKPTDNA